MQINVVALYLLGRSSGLGALYFGYERKVTPASIRIYGMLNEYKISSAVHGKWSNHVDGDTGIGS